MDDGPRLGLGTAASQRRDRADLGELVERSPEQHVGIGVGPRRWAAAGLGALEHQREASRLRQAELDVRAAHCEQVGPRARDSAAAVHRTIAGVQHRARELGEALRSEFAQHRRLVREVTIARGRRHPDLPGRFAEAEAVGARTRDELE